MGASGRGQFGGAELKNRWYTGVGWDLQPYFHDLKSPSGESDQRTILRQKAGETLVNKNVLCYFLSLGERTDAMLPVGGICSLVFMVEWLGLIQYGLCMDGKSKVMQ